MSGMSRRHYVMIANAISDARHQGGGTEIEDAAIDDVVSNLCGAFAEDNPNFAADRFRDAAGPAGENPGELSDDQEHRELIEQARAIEPNFEVPGDEPGRFENVEDKELGAALEVLIGHGFEDECAAMKANGEIAYRFGRWCIWRNANGSWVLTKWSTVEEAITELNLASGGEESEES